MEFIFSIMEYFPFKFNVNLVQRKFVPEESFSQEQILACTLSISGSDKQWLILLLTNITKIEEGTQVAQ